MAELSSVEKEILKCFERGDTRAMDLLYDNYADTLYGIALKIVGDEAKAQDILQESFVKIWKRSRHYDASKGRLFTWLLTIVRNQSIDFIRKRDRRGEIQGSSNDVHLQNVESGDVDVSVKHDIGKVLKELDKDKRELIEHSFILGYTHPEIAEKFDIPLGTVKTKIRAAMHNLREIFGNGR
ncbi:MAG: RNA polymerase sigma factor [Cryomorphaceae bacterium]|nr:sigma-70 family RNA polymerase sigma factor [Flavobacteriales bacterium]